VVDMGHDAEVADVILSHAALNIVMSFSLSFFYLS